MDDDDDYSSPDNSPPEVRHEIPAAPGLSYSPSSPLSSLSSDIDSPPHNFSNLAGPYSSYAPNQKAAYAAPGYPAFVQHTNAAPNPVRYPNRATTLTLFADGMTPLNVNIDRLVPPEPLPARTPPQTLRVRLSIPPVSDARAPPNLHGFFGSVRLVELWASTAKVFTRAYDPQGHCLSAEAESLQVSSVELGTVVAALPESVLSRARWLDAGVQTITQQVVVDNVTLLLVVYDLDRRASALPSAELTMFQKYADGKPPMSSPTMYASPPSSQYNPALQYPASASASAQAQQQTTPQTYMSNGYYVPQPQPQMYGHPPPPINTASSYTPSLSSALTPVTLRSLS
ncbi:hypothetical protein K438DRAFT_1235375 [Mycena galopus ATCC 62051]|nr:hypothetical protein K438DRAFT_1235375 [Mycena galopus ATCC 62051]